MGVKGTFLEPVGIIAQPYLVICERNWKTQTEALLNLSRHFCNISNTQEPSLSTLNSCVLCPSVCEVR
jgi:hypothetical protein